MDEAEIDALTADDGLLHLSPTLIDTSHITGNIAQVKYFVFYLKFKIYLNTMSSMLHL